MYIVLTRDNIRRPTLIFQHFAGIVNLSVNPVWSGMLSVQQLSMKLGSKAQNLLNIEVLKITQHLTTGVT